jgi:hypothetical protein
LNGLVFVELEGANLLPNIFAPSFAGSGFVGFTPFVAGCVDPNAGAAAVACEFWPKLNGAAVLAPNGDFAGSAGVAAEEPNVNEDDCCDGAGADEEPPKLKELEGAAGVEIVAKGFD